jgi:hypothetical protein
MNRGLCTNFHSAAESSVASAVNRVWNLCKSRMKSPDAASFYPPHRQIRNWF